LFRLTHSEVFINYLQQHGRWQ